MKKVWMPTLFVFSVALVLVVMTGQPARADAPLKTVTGTVVSINGDDLTLRTPTGDMTFDMDKNTERPASMAVNSQVTVWYDSDDDPADEPDARRITMVPATSTPPASVTTETRREIDTAPKQEVAPQQESTELPATAGPLPLLAGSGLFALAGGAFLRKLSRRA